MNAAPMGTFEDPERRRDAIAERVVALAYLAALGAWVVLATALGTP